MLILSLDSSGSGCAACLWRDGEVLVLHAENMERGQDRRLVPIALAALQAAGVAFHELDRIAVVRGPGSFTGLRIGLAAARGFGLAAGKPVIGIDRFAIYRAQFPLPHRNLLVVLDSKRSELFCRFYPLAGSPHEPGMMTHDEIAVFLQGHRDTVAAGDVDIAQSATENEALTAAVLAATATPGESDFLPRPLYIRAPDVTFPRAATGR
jgi:tRNA threonylcarbamoyladenosine biosynthesis protein TsaB